MQRTLSRMNHQDTTPTPVRKKAITKEVMSTPESPFKFGYPVKPELTHSTEAHLQERKMKVVSPPSLPYQPLSPPTSDPFEMAFAKLLPMRMDIDTVRARYPDTRKTMRQVGFITFASNSNSYTS